MWSLCGLYRSCLRSKPVNCDTRRRTHATNIYDTRRRANATNVGVCIYLYSFRLCLLKSYSDFILNAPELPRTVTSCRLWNVMCTQQWVSTSWQDDWSMRPSSLILYIQKSCSSYRQLYQGRFFFSLFLCVGKFKWVKYPMNCRFTNS